MVRLHFGGDPAQCLVPRYFFKDFCVKGEIFFFICFYSSFSPDQVFLVLQCLYCIKCDYIMTQSSRPKQALC